MRKVPLAGAAAALVLGVAGALAIPAMSHAAGPSPAKSKTLVFDVVFSPFEFVQANNVRNPHSPFSLGDELVFHDQLFSSGQHVGDEAGSCVIVDVSPADFYAATWIAMLNYRETKTWRALQHNGMAADFSWPRSAERYDFVYRRAAAA